MKQRCKMHAALMAVLFVPATILSQEAIPTTGGNAGGNGGSVTFTIGLLGWNFLQGTTDTFLEGVQQPYEISIVTSVPNTENITLVSMVYPNPTDRLIKLKVESSDFKNLRFQLFSVKGSVLKDEKIKSEEIEISMENLPPAVYFLRVFVNDMEVKVFRIIKR